jgi:hypothetical protein
MYFTYIVHPQNVSLQNVRFQNVRWKTSVKKILLEEFLAVGRNDQAIHSRTLEKSYQRQDTQSSVNDFCQTGA